MAYRSEGTFVPKNFDQSLFVVNPEKNYVLEYLNQENINSFLNVIENEPTQEQINKDVIRFKFIYSYNESNQLEEEIRKEFEGLPIVSRLMIHRSRLN